MSEPVVRYVPRGDITPEEERETLARAYAYVLRAKGGKKANKIHDEAAPPTAPERRSPNKPEAPSKSTQAS